MKKIKIAAVVLALFMGMASLGTLAQACPSSGCSKADCPKKSEKSVKDKFFKKVHMIYMYQDELGVTDEQLDKIKEIKIALKKDHIQKDAEIELIKIDIHGLLYADTVDVEAANKLIDKKYSVKKAKSKKCIASYAELKSVLNKEQMAKLKDLYMSEKKSSTCKYSSKGSKK